MAPDVGFVHDFLGAVDIALFGRIERILCDAWL